MPLSVNAYILRRNNWGEPSCDLIKEAYPELQVINKDKETVPVADWCIRWATTSDVPGKPKVINKAKFIHTVYNKATFRKLLADKELSPKTTVNSYPTEDMYPAVVRHVNHYGSHYLCVAEKPKDMEVIIKDLKEAYEGEYKGYYCSEFIDKDKEYRALVVSGRIVAVLEKVPNKKTAQSVAWGADGTEWKYIGWNHWPISLCKVAVESFRLSGLDFGAVDLMSKGKDFYCLEINSGPLLSPYYAGQFAKGLRWIIEKDDRSFIEPGEANSYKSFIHPALEGQPN